jgi:hypothetical protein
MAMRPIRGYRNPKGYPSTEYQLRHIYRNRLKNGLAGAFSRVGNRVIFDPEKLNELMAVEPRDNSAA